MFSETNREVLRCQLHLRRIARTLHVRHGAVIWAPARGRWPARFAVVTVPELEHLDYMRREPWRLVGVYDVDVGTRLLAGDIEVARRQLALGRVDCLN